MTTGDEVIMKRQLQSICLACSLLAASASHAVLWTVDDNLAIEYYVDREDNINFIFNIKTNLTGWYGICFHEFMFPGDCIIVSNGGAGGTITAMDFYNPGIPTLPNFPAPLQDTNPIMKLNNGDVLNNVNNVKMVGSTNNSDGTTSVHISRALQTGDIFDMQFEPGLHLNVVAAYNLVHLWDFTYGAQQVPHTNIGATRMIIDSDY